ncbi:hypothetical protein [Flavobacterium terrisoli]|uniref:hypothetical protein n=1 Tax=Flavobacterium terrisoli TaxID=3242195 RepID=UPI00254292D0|nr:hypothetical protein [Flavobacterium buctense]
MKNFFLILIFLSSALCFSQRLKCTVYLTDGTTKEGVSRFKANDDVKFRMTDDSEPEIISKEKIEKINLEENGIIGTYRYKIATEEIGLWLKEEAVGEVCLYSTRVSGFFYGGGASFNSAGGVGVGAGVMMGGGEVIHYYVCHQNDTEVFKITSIGNISKNFKKAASEFFKDCPELVGKIESKEFKKDDIEKVVWFYNNHCVTK